LYIELENLDVVCDDDQDFAPIERLPPKIFQSLIRLQNLDILAWIADVDRGSGLIPEKAIICRRRPSEQNASNKQQKTVWISRIESVYQESHAEVRNYPTEVHGAFEGGDASQAWLGGRRSWLSEDRNYWANGEYLLGEDVEQCDLLSDEDEETSDEGREMLDEDEEEETSDEGREMLDEEVEE
jgi:hypothetical protein